MKEISFADDTYDQWDPFPRLTITNNNNNRDNARSGTPEIRLVPGQIANIISYRIIMANCSRLPLPTSLHTVTPVATQHPRSLCPPPAVVLYQNPLYLSLSFVSMESTCSMPRPGAPGVFRVSIMDSSTAK